MRHLIFMAVALTAAGCVSFQSATNYPSIILDETILEQPTRRVPQIEGTWNPTLKMARQLEIDLPQLNGSTAKKLPGAEDWMLDVSGYTYQYHGLVRLIELT